MSSKRIVLIAFSMKEVFRHYLPFFREAGYEPFLVGNARDALACVETNKSDVVACIFDIMLPDGGMFTLRETGGGLKTGAVLYEKIHERYPGIPLILHVTGSVGRGWAERFEKGQVEVVHLADLGPSKLIEMINVLAQRKLVA